MYILSIKFSGDWKDRTYDYLFKNPNKKDFKLTQNAAFSLWIGEIRKTIIIEKAVKTEVLPEKVTKSLIWNGSSFSTGTISVNQRQALLEAIRPKKVDFVETERSLLLKKYFNHEGNYLEFFASIKSNKEYERIEREHMTYEALRNKK